LSCTDPGVRPGAPTRIPVLDPWGKKVTKGHYAYLSQSGHFLRVIPCGSRTKVVPEAIERLGDRAYQPLRRLVLNIDPDVSAGEVRSAEAGLQIQDVLHQV